MAKSSDEMAAAMIANLEKNTGKSLSQWIEIAKKSGETKHRAILNHIKSNHGLTYGFANLIALKTLKSDAGSSNSEDLIAAQYSGAKAHLKPIYDKLMKDIMAFGSDVEVAPKKAYVSIRRKKQFAIIQPSTKTRLDVGLNNKELSATERLEISGSFNSMVSHRVRTSSTEDIDEQLIGWLKSAYENAG